MYNSRMMRKRRVNEKEDETEQEDWEDAVEVDRGGRRGSVATPEGGGERVKVRGSGGKEMRNQMSKRWRVVRT